MSEKHDNTFQRRPNGFLYFLAGIYFFVYCKIKCHLKVRGVKPKGPAVIISNHASNEDYKVVAVSAYPRRINFLGTYHWFTFKKFAFWLKVIGVIPKYQFATDLQSFRKMQYVLKENRGMIFIAPEGTIFANGKLGFISPSIAKMIRMFRVPVYACRIEGTGLGMAKWSKRLHKTHVTVTTELIVKEEECGKLSVSEIMERINSSLSYNEFEYQSLNDIRIKDKDLAEGFETMFYKCPCCNSEFKLKTYGNTVECTECGTKAHIGVDFRFKWDGEKQYFDNYIQWYDWQKDELKKEMRDPSFVLEEEVEYGIDKDGVDNYIKVGKGTMTLSHNGWDYKGTFNDQYVEEHDDPAQVLLATLKTGLHFELPYRFDHCRVFFPKNGLTSMKWHLASRVMSELLAEKD
ncbi:MAG: 1-acyl-sn-glycerol-3-phosphate acyltransferase [Sphaerochaetaceae bacterium]|nr:1-acyl-sn-glycerol-3-phosphate acyltransferase [Sphaerochaetaceae bacterium]